MRWVGYQRRWLADRSQQKLVVKSRRIGFSEVRAFESATRACGVDLIVGKQIAPVNQNFISASAAQAKDLLAKCMKHVGALCSVVPGLGVKSDGATLCRLSNGAELRAFSSNPNSIRGGEGDVTLDEFGAMPRKEKVWRAAAPMAKPNLGRPEGYQIVIIGTPEGDDNLFWKMARGDLKHSFSQHSVTVQQAVEDGFPLMVQKDGKMVPGTVEDLKAEIGDPDAFAQEYECSFLASSMRYISEELLNEAIWEGEMPRLPSLRFGGMDVARENDASAIALLERAENTLWQYVPVETQFKMAWDAQEAWVDRKIVGVSKFAVDQTGIGSQFAERLQRKHGSMRVEPLTFTNAIKEELATGMKLVMGRHGLKLLLEDVDLRRDILLLRREITSAGNVRFDAPRTKAGHADRAWALALAIYASGLARETHAVPTIHTPTTALPVEQLSRAASDRFARPKRGAWR